MLALGADIPSIADGVVRGKSSEGPLGNCVALDHSDGAFSAYCHMKKPPPLELGQLVNIGDAVGRVGGSPKVPVHLHMTMGWSLDAMSGIGTFDLIPYIATRMAEPKPDPEHEKAESERPAPAQGIALTRAFAVAV